MKKVLRYLILSLMTVFFSIPCFHAAEAATVALLPLVNNTDNEMSNKVFYKEALGALKLQKGFVLVENDQLTAAINAAKLNGQLPNAAQMQKIAVDGNVDIVIAMQLDVLKKSVRPSSEERTVLLDLQGQTVAYNALTGKVYSHKIDVDAKAPEAVTSRWDWANEQWGRQVRLEMEKALKAQ